MKMITDVTTKTRNLYLRADPTERDAPFLFFFTTAAHPASETMFFKKRYMKKENALHRRMHSIVKRQC